MSVDTFQENLERFIVTTCSGVTFIELNYLEGRKWEVLGGGVVFVPLLLKVRVTPTSVNMYQTRIPANT